MKIQEHPDYFSVELTHSKWEKYFTVLGTIFSVVLFSTFIYMASRSGWDMAHLQWTDEGGNEIGSAGNVIVSLMFLAMSGLFSVIGLRGSFGLIFNPMRRITIDRSERGFVREFTLRHWRENRERVWPKTDVQYLDMTNSNEDYFALKIVLLNHKISVTNDPLEKLNPFVEKMNGYLGVEIKK
jgi:hypothetical protein